MADPIDLFIVRSTNDQLEIKGWAFDLFWEDVSGLPQSVTRGGKRISALVGFYLHTKSTGFMLEHDESASQRYVIDISGGGRYGRTISGYSVPDLLSRLINPELTRIDLADGVNYHGVEFVIRTDKPLLEYQHCLRSERAGRSTLQLTIKIHKVSAV